MIARRPKSDQQLSPLVPRGNDDRHTGISNEVADVFVVFLAFYSLIACVFGKEFRQQAVGKQRGRRGAVVTIGSKERNRGMTNKPVQRRADSAACANM
ncbi:hypothetical protein VTJ04DRAFT_5744 [Mycothermus thermophilus]|uniref:uncharacterized protein n=1 Tax=Humicola insolens TaxID=85995 RepID=UPI003742EFEE